MKVYHYESHVIFFSTSFSCPSLLPYIQDLEKVSVSHGGVGGRGEAAVTNASSWRGPSLSSLFSVGNDDQHSIDGANSAWLYFIRLFVYRKCSNPVNYLKQQLLMTLQEVLLDDGRPFCSHYGAVVGLTELGPEVKSDCLHSQFCIFSCDCREWSPNSRGPVHFSCGERRKSEERAN